MNSVDNGKEVPKPVESNGHRPCSFCGELIAAGAVLCPKCNSYQRPWRNELKYWSGVVGLVTLVVSGLTFSLDAGRAIYQDMFSSDLAVSDFSSTDIARIWNISRTDVWITHVHIKSRKPVYDFQVTTSHVIKPNDVLEFNFLKLAREQWSGFVGDLIKGNIADYGTDLSADEISDLEEDIVDTKENFVTDFLLRNGPEHRHLLSIHGRDLFTYACKLRIYYRISQSDTQQVLSVPCVGTVRRLNPYSPDKTAFW
jgi:hypothetical protein